MLDDATKKRINTLRQILVGKLPDPKAQVEQITNALIYKFMNDMDEESVSMGGKATYFSGSFQKYSWKNLMNSQTSGVEKLSLYAEALNKMSDNENLPTLFRDIFKDSVLPFKDPATLNMFLKEINEFHYSNSEKLGDAFEYLLSFMGSQGDAGQFRTPRHIIDFITEIVNPQKNETVLDPACGTAGFLISTYKHLLKQNTKKNLGDGLSASDRKKIGENLNGYDISPDMVKMSLVNMYLHKFTNPKINEYDTLSSEDKWNEYYDVILANPPFFSPKGGITPHNRFSIQSTKAEILFIDYINEHLKPNGRAGIIIPEGVKFQTGSAYKQLRKKLVETSLIGIVSLPAGVFNPYSGVKTSILILDKKNKINKKIFFAEVKNDGFSLGAQRNSINKNDLPKIISDLKNYPKIESNKHITLVDKNEIINNENFNLSLVHYSKSEIESSYQIVKIKDVLKEKPLYGSGASKTEFDKKVRYLRITDISKYGYLKSENIVSPSKIEKEYFLKFNDILFARSGSVGRCYLHKEFHGNYQFAGYLIKFPLNEELINPNYLFYITKGSLYTKWIESIKKQGTISNINAKEYSSFEFPLPSLEMQNQIVLELEGYEKTIVGCRQVIKNYKPYVENNFNFKKTEIGKFIKIQSGFAFKSSLFNEDDGFPIIRIRNIKKNLTKTKYSGEYDDSYIVKNGDLLIGMDGEFNTCIWKGGDALLNQRVCRIKAINNINLKYLYYILSEPLKKIEDNTQAVTVKHISAKQISEIKLPIPDIKLQNEIVEELDNFEKVIDGNRKIIQKFQKKIINTIDKICLK